MLFNLKFLSRELNLLDSFDTDIELNTSRLLTICDFISQNNQKDIF